MENQSKIDAAIKETKIRLENKYIDLAKINAEIKILTQQIEMLESVKKNNNLS